MARSYPDKDLKLLWGLSAARCAFPDCRQICVAEATELDSAVVLGKIAHIVAHSDKGPRADPSMPVENRDRYDNWILLCPTHHDLVDGQASTFTVDSLIGWKKNHEDWVRSALAQEMPGVSFAELEIVTKSILCVPASAEPNFLVIDPAEKMKRNNLTHKIHFLLTMGLAKAKEVGQFVEHVATMNSDFPDCLIAGFTTEYQRLWEQDVRGDALFESLREFASARSKEFKYQAAGLAVLAYLFEKCEVFER